MVGEDDQSEVQGDGVGRQRPASRFSVSASLRRLSSRAMTIFDAALILPPSPVGPGKGFRGVRPRSRASSRCPREVQLRPVEVLRLVHEQRRAPGAPAQKEARVGFELLERAEHQVVEVAAAGPADGGAR